MLPEENKAIIRRFYEEVWVKGSLAVAEELVADQCILHPPDPRLPPGPLGQLLIPVAFRKAFPDFHLVIELMLAEGDLVAARWAIQGTHEGKFGEIPPTGKYVSDYTGTQVFRLAGGKIVEIWINRDDLRLLWQLGAASLPAQPRS